jgi:hypothetical protein
MKIHQGLIIKNISNNLIKRGIDPKEAKGTAGITIRKI